MDLHLEGKIAVVTGASKGIGLAVTRALVGEGATVVAGARSIGPDLAALQDARPVVFVPVDLAGPAGPIELIERARQLGGVDILVNNAGAVTPRPDGFASVTDDDWERSIALTLMAAVRTTRAALPEMARPWWRQHHHHQLGERVPAGPVGHRLFGRQGRADQFLQVTVERGWSAGHPRQHDQSGTGGDRAVARRSGVAQTVARAAGIDPAAVAANAAAGAVTGRFTRPAEIADLVLVLASDRAGNVTGADFSIDGGLVQTL